MTDLDTLLAESDVVSLHARVTEETRGFLAAPQFARMKRGAYFINTARGPMVNYDDLYQALASAARARRHAGDLLAGAAAAGRAAAQARQRHAHAAHRRRLHDHGADRRAHGRRGGPPLAGRRAAAQPLLNGNSR